MSLKKGFRAGYHPEGYPLNCQWLTCWAGCGIAGNGNCFLGGYWWWHKCPKYKSEKAMLKKYKKKENNEL